MGTYLLKKYKRQFYRSRLNLYSGKAVKVQMQCLLSFLMLVCYYCLDGTRSGYFGHVTSQLEEYLPLDEQLLPPPAVDLVDTWDFWIQGPHNT